MNENFEKYLKDLDPELQEKARECKTKEELNAFIAENDLELPEDALELVAGGCGTSTERCYHQNVTELERIPFPKRSESIYKIRCNLCGEMFYHKVSNNRDYCVSEEEYNKRKLKGDAPNTWWSN